MSGELGGHPARTTARIVRIAVEVILAIALAGAVAIAVAPRVTTVPHVRTSCGVPLHGETVEAFRMRCEGMDLADPGPGAPVIRQPWLAPIWAGAAVVLVAGVVWFEIRKGRRGTG